MLIGGILNAPWKEFDASWTLEAHQGGGERPGGWVATEESRLRGWEKRKKYHCY